MVAVYWANANKLLGKEYLNELLAQLPKSIKDKILAYADKAEQTVRCISKLMLNRFSEDYGLNHEIALEQLQYTVEGKPYFPNTSFSFNSTHSGPIVLGAAVQYGRVGIDAERIRAINPNYLVDYFTERETREIEASSNPQKTLLTLWTRKEALMKAAGHGILIDLASVEVIENAVLINDHWFYLHEIELHPEYIVYLATDRLDAQIGVNEFYPAVPDFRRPEITI